MTRGCVRMGLIVVEPVVVIVTTNIIGFLFCSYVSPRPKCVVTIFRLRTRQKEEPKFVL